MSLTRRTVVAGTLALGLLPALRAAAASADAELRATLDTFMQSPDIGAAERLAALQAFRTEQLSTSAALDLQVARADATVELRLADADAAQRYALLLERELGLAISAQRALHWLEREAQRLHARADQLLRQLGLARGTVGARFLQLGEDARWRYTNDEQGRAAAVTYMNECVQRARALLPRLFDAPPAWCLQVNVRTLSAAEAQAGTQGYRVLPAPDNAGAYIVDLRDMTRRPRWTLPSVVHHELLPGHLLQFPLETLAGAHPLRLRCLRAFGESWAVYGEEAMAGTGMYRRDPAAELGMLHWLLFRALRGVADVGMHHAGWSSEQALQRLRDEQGLAAYFAPFEPDLERIARQPAVRAAEALGWLWLRHARSAARRPVRQFHDLVLREGRQPLALLAQRLDIRTLPQDV